MQGMCNYIPETNHVSRIYSVEAILCLQYTVYVMLFPMLNVLYLYNSTSRSKWAVSSTAILCRCLVSCLPSMLLFRYSLNDCELVPFTPIITDVLLLLLLLLNTSTIA